MNSSTCTYGRFLDALFFFDLGLVFCRQFAVSIFLIVVVKWHSAFTLYFQNARILSGAICVFIATTNTFPTVHSCNTIFYGNFDFRDKFIYSSLSWKIANTNDLREREWACNKIPMRLHRCLLNSFDGKIAITCVMLRCVNREACVLPSTPSVWFSF